MEGKGDVSLSIIDSEIKICYVNFVSGLTMNLLFVGSIANHNFVLIFHAHQCFILYREKLLAEESMTNL